MRARRPPDSRARAPRRPIVVTVGLVVLAACGDDGSVADATSTAATTTTASADDPDTTAGTAGTDPAPTGPVAPLTGAEICERLDAAMVGEALGIEVIRVSPDDSATPQCAYSYTSPSGVPSNATIAFMRPDRDLGGRSGREGYEYVVSLNRSIAGSDAEIVELPVGDGGTRLSGLSLHLGVLSTEGRILTVLVPTGDVTPAAVDALIAAVAGTLTGGT